MLFVALFTSSVMLWWALAAAVPIILHLLSRRHRQSLRFAAIQFVFAAYQKSHRRFRFWQWLLLLLRVFAMLLFAAALADPIINANGRGGNERNSQLWVLVVDSSMSMKTQDEQQSRFAEAIEQATELCVNTANGDGYLVVQASSQMQWAIDSISLDPVAVQQTLRSLKPSDSTTSIARTIEGVTQRLSSIRQANLWTEAIHVVIYSDLQATSWEGVSEKTTLPPDVSMQVVDVGNPATVNHYVRSLSIDPSVFVVQQPIRFRSECFFANDQPSENRLVQMLVDGVAVESRRVEIDGAGEGSLVWEVALSKGEHIVAVQLADDALNADNIRRIVVNVQDKRRVACVATEAANSRFVATALRSGTTGAIEVQEIETTRLASLQANAFDLIVLCDTGMLRNEDASTLKSFLRNGTDLMIWLGPRCDPEVFNRLFGVVPRNDLLAVGSIQSLSDEGQYTVDPLGYRHPIVEAFRSYPDSGLAITPIFRYWKLNPIKNAAIQPVLGIGEGDPLMLHKRVIGSADLVIVTTAAYPTMQQQGEAWNALALWPSFVPLIQEALAVMQTPIDETDPALQLVNTATGQGREGQGAEQARFLPITDDRGTIIDAAPQWPVDAGVYQRQTEPSQADTNASRLVVVNPPPQESDLTKIDPSRLPAIMRLDDKVEPSANQALPTTRANSGRPLFVFILAALIICLLLESWLARRLKAFA